jgi:prephenate dehydratase
MGEALAALHRRCDQVRFLGSYPRAADGPGGGDARPAAPDDVAGTDEFLAAAEWLAGLRAGTRA